MYTGLAAAQARQEIEAVGADVQLSSPQGFADFWISEFARYKELIRISGAKLE